MSQINPELTTLRDELANVQNELKRLINVHQMMRFKQKALGTHYYTTPCDMETRKSHAKDAEDNIAFLKKRQQELIIAIRNSFTASSGNDGTIRSKPDGKTSSSKEPKIIIPVSMVASKMPLPVPPTIGGVPVKILSNQPISSTSKATTSGSIPVRIFCKPNVTQPKFVTLSTTSGSLNALSVLKTASSSNAVGSSKMKLASGTELKYVYPQSNIIGIRRPVPKISTSSSHEKLVNQNERGVSQAISPDTDSAPLKIGPCHEPTQTVAAIPDSDDHQPVVASTIPEPNPNTSALRTEVALDNEPAAHTKPPLLTIEETTPPLPPPLPQCTQSNNNRDNQRTADVESTGSHKVTEQLDKVAILQAVTSYEQADEKPASTDQVMESPKEEQSIDFMAALNLVTPAMLNQLEERKNERRKRKRLWLETLGVYKPQKKIKPQKISVPTLFSTDASFAHPELGEEYDLFTIKPPPEMPEILLGKRQRKAPQRLDATYTPLKPARTILPRRKSHDDLCAVCEGDGELLLCDTCNLVFHIACIRLPVVPEGDWSCDKCNKMKQISTDIKKKRTNTEKFSDMAENLEKKQRSKERKQLIQKNNELLKHTQSLKNQLSQLNAALHRCMADKESVQVQQGSTSSMVEKLTAVLSDIRRKT